MTDAASTFTVQSRKVVLRDYVVACQIGIHDFEQGKKQRVTVTIELDIDPAVAPRDDDLASVVDYDFLREEIKALIDENTYNLQETLCHDIMGLCLKKDGVTGALVRTCKPDVYDDCDGVCYEMTARRP